MFTTIIIDKRIKEAVQSNQRNVLSVLWLVTNNCYKRDIYVYMLTIYAYYISYFLCYDIHTCIFDYLIAWEFDKHVGNNALRYQSEWSIRKL